MEEIRNEIARWFDEGSKVVFAQVVKTWGSSPRIPGSVMAISEKGQIAGSVSGGCIEGSVVQAALGCMGSSCGSMEEFHASTRRAQEVGLSCGGSIDVLVAQLDHALFEAECDLLERDIEYLRVSITKSTQENRVGMGFLLVPAGEDISFGKGLERVSALGELGYEIFAPKSVMQDRAVESMAGAVSSAICRKSQVNRTGHIDIEGNEWFFARVSPKPMLVCVGGVHIAIHLTRMAKELGYKTVVIDPRGMFSTEERFQSVDRLMHAWPQKAFKELHITASTAVCALTHDPKIDVPALALALETTAFYIGSLGRLSTQLVRYRQLAELGIADDSIARIFGPIGLDLGGKEPSEIALSIIAEMTAVRHGSTYRMASLLESAHEAANPNCRILATA